MTNKKKQLLSEKVILNKDKWSFFNWSQICWTQR